MGLAAVNTVWGRSAAQCVVVELAALSADLWVVAKLRGVAKFLTSLAS